MFTISVTSPCGPVEMYMYWGIHVSVMMERVIEAVEPYFWDAILIIIIAIGCYFGLKHGLRSVHRSKMQSKSVIARARNKLTQKLWNDLLDIRIMGFLPVGQSIEDLLWDSFPRVMEQLEEDRVKNPIVWRENIKFLTPIALYLKTMAKYQPKQVFEHVFSIFANANQEGVPVSEEPIQSETMENGNENTIQSLI